MSTFVRLVRVAPPFSRSVATVALLGALAIGSSVGLIATSAYLISKAAVTTDVAALSLAITSVRLLAISRAVFRYLERLTGHSAVFRSLAQLRGWFFEAVEPLAPARLTRYHSGDLLARSVADIESLEGFYVRAVVPPIAAVLAVALSCVVLGAFAWTVVLPVLALMVLSGALLPLAVRQAAAGPSRRLVASRAELHALLVDEVQGMADLVVFDRAGDHRAHTLAAAARLRDDQQRLAMLRGVSAALSAFAVALAAFAVLWLAVPLVAEGRLSGVDLALLPLVTIASFEAVAPLPGALRQLEENYAAAGRLFEITDAAPPVPEPLLPAPAPAAPSLDLEDVRFRYAPGEPLVLDGLNLHLRPGERVGIAGGSGAGKSTVVNLLLRFWDYESGRIRLGGRDLRACRADDVRACIGVVPQEVHLFNATIRDNLLLADPDATDAQIADACRQALLLEFIDALPAGFDTMIGEDGVRLSGGERQRLAIARVILRAAPIVVMDEPTANLDIRTERELMDALEPFFAGRTVVLISHRRAVLDRAGRVVVLEGGRLRARASSAGAAAML